MCREKFSYLFLVLLLFFSSFSISAYADTATALSSANPVIQVIGYEIVEGNVELDSEFTIQVTIKNCNSYATAYNVIADVSSQDMDLRLTDGAVNQVYFQSIAPDATVSFNQTFSIEKTYPHTSAALTYSFRYSGEDGDEFTNQTTITPKVIIPCKLKVNVLSVASSASVGSQALVNVRCTNDGVIDMSSLVMKIDGNIIDSQKENDLGALKAGEQVMKDCYVNFLKEGIQYIDISFEYKDESGNSYTIPKTSYIVNVSSENTFSVSTTSKSGSGTIQIAGKTFTIKSLVASVIAIVVLVVVILKLLDSINKGRKNT
ncbi:MAG: hypothetical protein IJA27_03230 [Lachnospiraceae bacterium]|nr:hypothetical protein [Lachnospiraceae bacterium]